MKYKLLVLDLDGTTVASSADALPSPKVKQAIAKAKEKVKVSIATGRSYDGAKNVIDALGLEGPGIVNGGSEIRDLKTGELVHAKSIDHDMVVKLAEIAHDIGYDKAVRGEGVKKFIEHPSQVDGPKERFSIYDIDQEKIDEILEMFVEIGDVAVHHGRSWRGEHLKDVHITHAEATKKHALMHLAELEAVSKEDVIAIGNDNNDLPLMEQAGLSVAIGDSPDYVKQHSDYVTGTLEEDGVAQAIEKFILG